MRGQGSRREMQFFFASLAVFPRLIKPQVAKRCLLIGSRTELFSFF